MIDGVRQPERYFWNLIHCIATEEQIKRILDGNKLLINGSEYQILT